MLVSLWLLAFRRGAGVLLHRSSPGGKAGLPRVREAYCTLHAFLDQISSPMDVSFSARCFSIAYMPIIQRGFSGTTTKKNEHLDEQHKLPLQKNVSQDARAEQRDESHLDEHVEHLDESRWVC